MSPDERQMIVGLFDRMRGFGPPQKDADADAVIAQQIRANPDASYMLVQSVLVQEHVIQQQQARVDELEARVRELESHASRSQPQQSGGFLGGLFGGNGARPSVPAAGRTQAGFMPGQQAGQPMMGNRQSPWGQPQGGMMGQPQQQAGGGFMRTAMATAAGVAGGMLVANAIGSMMNSPGSSAQAADAGAGANDPGSSSFDANDPGLSQNASYDANDPGLDSGGDWGGGDEF